jgi:hypothetical protein
LLGVCAYDTLDPLVVGYLLELLHTRTIAGGHPVRTHHVDTTSLGNKILVDAAPNLKVVFDAVLIGVRSY